MDNYKFDEHVHEGRIPSGVVLDFNITGSNNTSQNLDMVLVRSRLTDCMLRERNTTIRSIDEHSTFYYHDCVTNCGVHCMAVECDEVLEDDHNSTARVRRIYSGNHIIFITGV